MRSLDAVVFVAALITALGLTGLVRRYAQRFNLLDVPNQRSSHQIATPRGGGVSIVIVFEIAVLVLYLNDNAPSNVFVSFFASGLLVAAIGFVDDHNHVPALWRLITQFVAATFAVATLGGLPQVQLGGELVDFGLVGDVLAIVFTVWLVNLFNFMDGIDGIAAIETVCIAAGALIISSVDGSGYVAILLVVFLAATLGFLAWNWPPAKIFMGDVGSGFLGFVLAVFAIISSSLGILSIWTWLILAGVFVVDATFTLLTRAINGEDWRSAHRTHAYQKASRRLNGHQPVTLSVLAINLVWLLPIAWFASTRPEFGLWLVLLAWAPLGVTAICLGAGRPDYP